MIDVFVLGALVFGITLLIPIVVFSAECGLALVPRRQAKADPRASRPRVAALIPAHNERGSIRRVIHEVHGQLQPGDRILVVADNCDDDTAEVADDSGAEVVIRRDGSRLGKSHALAFGLRHVANDPPQVVIVVDADCTLAPGAIGVLSTAAYNTDRPVQASYTFDCGNGSDTKRVVSSLAIFFKNHIRPLGLSRLGMPCQLTGCGMAFPWNALQDVRVDNTALTEDTQLGIDLLLAGHPPIFCPAAEVVGSVPTQWSTHMQQRRRWEHGYLVTIFTQVPRLLASAMLGRQSVPLWAAIDFLVPPLALLGILWCVATIVATALAVAAGAWSPLLLQVLGGLLMAISVFSSWVVFCRSSIPLQALLSAPWYVVRKLPIYGAFIWNRQKVWLRTQRD